MAIFYTDQVRASIGGPDAVYSGSNATYTADVSAGEAPFTYEWYNEWELVGTGSSYTDTFNGEGEMYLRLDVTDARGEVTSTDKRVMLSTCTQVIC